MPLEGRLWYEWHGPEAGEAVILSPGLGGSAHYWAPNLAALAERYRILLYDHRGTGRSGPLPPGPTSVEAMAGDVLALVKALGLSRPHFVGHALGGLIGLALARQCELGKLVVVNGWGRLDPYTGRCFDLRLEMLRSSGAETYLKAQAIFLYPAGWISERLEALDAHAARQLADFPADDTIERRIEAARAYAGPHDEVAVRALLIAAEDDMLVPAHCTRKLADAMTAPPRVATMAWGGHGCNVTDPGTFNRLVLEFLGS
ncbi:MAG: aminoacrylate hydrolase [Sphingomonadales bacterium]|jgi:aminoacrylate hydrolase|nr:aminoacrylate hydrolase [Sphingomonadales bacterium]